MPGSFKLVPNDPNAPLILFAGDAAGFGSEAGFARAVLAAKLTVEGKGEGSKLVTFSPPGGLPTIAFPWSESKVHR